MTLVMTIAMMMMMIKLRKKSFEIVVLCCCKKYSIAFIAAASKAYSIFCVGCINTYVRVLFVI